MDKPAEWREMLLQYRLNELDETRRDEIDGLLIADAEFSSAMQEAEYDLLDAYAANELSVHDRLRVERALNPAGRYSPESPDRVIHAAARPQLVAPAKPQPSRRWIYPLAAAAVLLVAAVVTAPLWRSHPTPRQAIATPTPTQPAPPPVAATQIEPSATPAVDKPTPTSAIATVLLPGALRSQDALSLTLAAEVKTVRFILPSSADQPASSAYELQVVGDNGQPTCRSHGVAAARRSVSFACPAASLPSGPSFVRVLALPHEADAAPLLEVTVSITRK